MMQGDSMDLLFRLEKSDGSPVTPEEVQDVEISLGMLRKSKSEDQVSYSEEKEMWLFPMTQEESFKLASSKTRAQVRVKWASGQVQGVSMGCVNVLNSTSKEVL